MRKITLRLLLLSLFAGLFVSACTNNVNGLREELAQTVAESPVGEIQQTTVSDADAPSANVPDAIPIYDNRIYIPDYSGKDVIIINNNVPNFAEYTEESYESYSELDSLGRCGVAVACIGRDLMPSEERGEIGSVTPSGWIQAKYDTSVTGSDSPYLYNRCHLIGFQLTGENANEKNLITGTRQLNVEMMLPYENMVTDYIRNTGNHVLYRVTPIFEGDELLARGVQMEAFSIEDSGEGICFNVFCYNVERGVTINYSTGESTGPEFTGSEPEEPPTEPTSEIAIPDDATYVLNTNSMKFHLPECDSVERMAEHNREYVTWDRETCVQNGYSPCGACNP